VEKVSWRQLAGGGVQLEEEYSWRRRLAAGGALAGKGN
jgi:hypothetical protein